MKWLERHIYHCLITLVTFLPLGFPLPAYVTDEAPQAEAPLSDAQLAELIQQLGDPRYRVRQRAEKTLERLGFEAFDALNEAAQNSKDLEISTRAKYLVRGMQIQWTRPDDPEDVRKLLEDYHLLPVDKRQNRIDSLAGLLDSDGLAALCRLARYEKSPYLSKYAALQILKRADASPLKPAAQAELLRQAIGSSRRPAAQWLLAYADMSEQPAEALTRLNKLTAEQVDATKLVAGNQELEVTRGLLKLEAKWAHEFDRPQLAKLAIARLLTVELGDAATLLDSMQWLAERQAWEDIDKLAARFNAEIQTEPVLIYMLAHVRDLQGRGEEARQLEQQAKNMYPGRQREHMLVAQQLQSAGLMKYAEDEFRYVIGLPGNDIQSIIARRLLSYLLHDQLRHADAAEVLAQGVPQIDELLRRNGGGSDGLRETRNDMAANMHYYRALVLAEKGNRQEQVAELEQAIQADPHHADVLIALYRLPNPDEERQADTKRRIAESTQHFLQQIKVSPGSATHHNQYAWLVANTEGDKQAALAASRRSLELSPDSPGYLDTLARCYYALGQLEQAVRYQRRAVELDPHSGLLKSQLKKFEAELAKR